MVLRDTVHLDEEWMEEILELRGPVGEAISLVFDFLGGGWFAILVVPIGVAVAFCSRADRGPRSTSCSPPRSPRCSASC